MIFQRFGEAEQGHADAQHQLGSLLQSTPVQQLPDLFVMAIDASYDERLAVLNELDLVARFETALKRAQLGGLARAYLA